jgi:PAS domain S-box-containing protein
MNKGTLSQLTRYGLVALLAAVASALTHFVEPLQRIPFALSFGVVLLSSIYLGRGPGLFAVILSALAGAYMFLDPAFTFRIGIDGTVQALVFTAVALLIWSMTEKRRRAEEGLRSRERELSDFFENATVGLHWVGPDGKVLWANRAELELLGYTRDEYIGRNIAEFHADEDKINDILKRLSSGEELHGYEARLRRKDGSIRHVSINSNVYWEDGRFIHTRCFTRDITEHHRAQDALRFQAQLLDTVEQAVIATDARGAITYWNEFAGKLYGWSAAEVLGRDIVEVIPTEATREQAAEIMARVAAGESWSGEFDVRRRDGTSFPAMVTDTPVFDERGAVVGVVGVSVDITARRRAEAALREQSEVIEQAYDAIFLRDAANAITLWNRGAERTYGYAVTEALGRSPHELLKTETPVPLEEIYADLRRDGYWEGELRHTRKDGEQIVVETRWATVRDERGDVTSILEIVRDITERKRAEAMRRLLSAIVESSDDAIMSATLDRKIASWNAGAERMFGYTAAEALGEDATLLTPPDQLEDMTGRMEQFKHDRAPQHFETVRRAKDGRLVEVAMTFSAITDEGGRLIGISAVARDIAERKRAEATLREQSEVIEQAYDAIFLRDEKNAITLWNQGAVRTYGYSEAEALGRSPHELLKTETPVPLDEIYAHLRGEGHWEGELRHTRKDGEQIVVDSRWATVRDERGGVTSILEITRDITERQRAEATLREQTEIIETVNRVGQTLAGELDVHKLVQAVTDAATDISNAQFGSFFYNVLDESGESYMLYTLSGVPREAFAHFPMPRNTDIFAPTFKGEGTVLIPDVKQDPRYGKNSPYYGMPEGHLPVTSYLAVPVVSRSGEVYGGLFFGHPEEGVFTERAARIIEGLAAQAAIAMDNARLFDAVQRERIKAQASEEHYRFLAESIPQIVWTANADGSAEYFNQRWYDYTGLPRDDDGGYGARGVVHPEDRARVLDAWRRAFETGERYEVELRLRRGADESYRWHLARSIPLRDAEGKIVKWFGTSTDIDDRKRAEESQAFLAEASEVLVSSLDYEETLRRIAELVVPRLADWCAVDMLTDERALRRLAVAHQDPAKVEFAHELERRYPQNMNERQGVPNVVRTGEPELYPNIPDEMLALVARDAEQLKIMRELGLRSAMIVPLSVQGRVLGAITFISAESGRHYTETDLAFAEDLAHRAALAVENARLYREAQEVNRLKDEFLATLSHELRTPLTAVLGWTRLLGTGQLDKETSARALETIERNAQSQVQLIDDILDVSRIIRGKLRLSVRPVELAPVIEAAVDSVRPAADAKGICLQVILDRQAGPVSGDPDRLQQVIWNLLSNAIKFTPKEGRVQITLGRVNSHLEVSISDTGQGIGAEFLPFVFDRFRQADPTPTRAHGGLGLGLAIVRHLVELHGGSVKAESEGAGRGATFIITLPLLAAARDAAAASDPSSESEPRDGARMVNLFENFECPPEIEGLRVLLVEDDKDSRELLIAVLEQCRAEVVGVASAEAAMRTLEAWRPDVIVSDIEMPGEDGFTLMRRLRGLPAERGGDIPAAALTAYARPEDRMRALMAGFQIHVPKPVEPAELVAVVASLAGRTIKS